MSSSSVQVNPYDTLLQFASMKSALGEEPCTHKFILSDDLQGLQNWVEASDIENDERIDEIDYRVNNDYFKHGFSPLHIAAIMGNLNAAQILVGTRVCQMNVKDHGEATAMHHAAARGDRVFGEFLRTHGANDHFVDFYQGTPANVLSQCHFHNDPLQQRCFYIESGQMREGNGLDFSRLTGATFIDRDICITPLDWVKSWEKGCSGDTEKRNEILSDHQQVHLRSLYDAFIQKPPQVYLDSHDIAGYLLRAGEDMPAFTVIGEYLGEIDSEQREALKTRHDLELREKKRGLKKWETDYCYSLDPRYHYQLGKVDSFEKRGLMAMVSSSFPNIIVRELICQKGQESRIIFLTTELVIKGSILAFDYGEEHSVKRMPYVELREEAMVEFFQSRSWDQILDSLMHPDEYSDDPGTRLQELAEEAKVKYLMNTPTAMVRLVLGNVISCELAEEIFKRHKEAQSSSESGYLSEFVPFFSSDTSIQEEFLSYISNFLETIQGLPASLTEPVTTAILKACGAQSTLELLKKIDSEANRLGEIADKSLSES